MHYHFYTFFFKKIMVLSFKNNKTFKLYTPKKYLKWLLTFLCFFFNTTMVFSLKNQKIQRSRRTTFKFTIKNISKFILWKIIFFSIIPFTTASVVDVDKDYKSYQDVYDGLLNALFPIFFVILFQIKNSSTTRKQLLPILDDILYNFVTWSIPLIVSSFYNELFAIRMFAYANMGLHLPCAAIGIASRRTIKEVEGLPKGTRKYYIFTVVFLFCYTLIAIPIFWVIYLWPFQINYNYLSQIDQNMKNKTAINDSLIKIIKIRSDSDSISIIFTLLFCLPISTFYFEKFDIVHLVPIYCFYVPNILQTLIIMLKWPINFYFVKSWLFILLLSSTRNISYYIDKVPKDFLATSTTYVQYRMNKGIFRKSSNDDDDDD